MRAGIGFNNEKDALASGRKIAAQAVKDGGIENAAFAIAFCNSNVDADNLLEGIREVIRADVPVIGGSAIGIITNHVISYEDYPAGIIIIEDDDIEAQIGSAAGLDKDGVKTGRDLAGKFVFKEDDKILLFYDSINKPPENNMPPQMNPSKALIQGMEEVLTTHVPIYGGGTLGDYNFSPTIQFTGDSVKSQSAAALRLGGNINIDAAIMHGCSPKDGIYHTITRMEGPVIHEIDNRPIVEAMNEIYASEDWQEQLPVRRLTIGINHGEKFGREYVEEDYVNRLIVGILPDKSGIVIFEPDLENGTEIQFMLRDSKTMIESARRNTEMLINKIKKTGKTPEWGFYIDCAGRTALFSDSLTEEAQEVQNIFNDNDIPLFGFYSGVEIAPFIKKNRGLDWTGVLLIFSK